MDINLEVSELFATRHIGPRHSDIQEMLKKLNVESCDQLMDQCVPDSIRSRDSLDLAGPVDEWTMTSQLKKIAKKNRVGRSFLGFGYYGTKTPNVIQRMILENPGWYTQYTPYQPEISQGRLEALLNFQTMVAELTGLPVANASLLDEGTAAAEAMYLAHSEKNRKGDRAFYMSEECFPQTKAVVQTRARALGLEVKTFSSIDAPDFADACGVLVQYPDADGAVVDYSALIASAQKQGALAIMAADPLSLALLRSPGELGADIAVGSTQRFGVPMGFGGPHAAYFATKEAYQRKVPGRIVGVSQDRQGRQALRLALQTREQHIRREKATSNICTAQALLANMAGAFAVYHGPEGLKRIAESVHQLAVCFADTLTRDGQFKIRHQDFFDTVVVDAPGKARQIAKKALQKDYLLNAIDEDRLLVAFDELSSDSDIRAILSFMGVSAGLVDPKSALPENICRKGQFMKQAVFHAYRSETEMMRYLKRLENKDLSLTSSMIPLGSCTMKLNAAAELMPITWPELNQLHPFVDPSHTEGYRELLLELEGMIARTTGFDAVSLQPNSGAQGEYAGLLAIKAYHEANGNTNRNVCLIPASAHGTNPASAALASMKVVTIKCDSEGNVDLDDLRKKAEKNQEDLAALMITYPSTHGVFEESVREVCSIVHQFGGQVYMDGANFQAQLGLCYPGHFGPDVCHLNLHKTFCIPHGGGGPGMGPIAVKEHLAAYLPSHPLNSEVGGDKSFGPVAAAPWGSPSILPISWAYIKMMGGEGLLEATKVAILSANYVAKRLEGAYSILYKGARGRVAHECVVDVREFKKAGVQVADIAKRLMDYGFHAPTISFPVGGTMMIEPTESESLEELDRFCDALLAIREEIREVESGKVVLENSPLSHAPHTAEDLSADEWPYAYSRAQAAYPLEWIRGRKFWPSVGRIDEAYGDRNFMCTCS